MVCLERHESVVQKESASSMRVLVTGVTGLVGRHLIRRLVMDGHETIGVVRQHSASKVSHLEDVSFLRIDDIAEAQDWFSKLHGIDAIVHLAARVHVMRETATDPLQAFRKVNLMGTRRLAEAAVAVGVSRFVYISTIKVNGERTSGSPFTADDVCAPEDPYAISKLEAEQALKEFGNQSSTEFVTIRPPLVYGPGVGGNLERLMKLVRTGVPLPLAAITNRRSMVSIGNLVDFISVCMTHPRAANQTFLVSDGYDWSTPELVSEIATFMGRRSRLFRLPVTLIRQLGGIFGAQLVVDRLCDSLEVSITKNDELLHWAPVQPKGEALETMVNAYLKGLHGG